MESCPMAPLSSPETRVSSSNAVVNVLSKPFRFTVPSLQVLMQIAETQRNRTCGDTLQFKVQNKARILCPSEFFSHILSIIDRNGKGRRPGFSRRTFTCRETARIVPIYHQTVLSLRNLTRSFSLSGFATQRACYSSAEISTLSVAMFGRD